MVILSVWALLERNRAELSKEETEKANVKLAEATTAAVNAKQRLSKEYEDFLVKVLRNTPAYGAVLGELQPSGEELRDVTRIARTDTDATMALLGRFGQGRIIALAHDAFINSDPANLLFFEIAIKWASPNSQAERILYSVGHCEVISYPSASPNEAMVLPLKSMRNWDYEVAPIQVLSDRDMLDKAELLIIGNAWASFTPAEIVSVVNYVRDGGALILAGLKWSFDGSAGYPDFQPCAFHEASAGRQIARGRYPMNDIANRLGINFGQKNFSNSYSF